MSALNLSAGNWLGPYEIVKLLGVGGMGEVYRARDSRLRRDVAIKVLPAGVTGDQELLKRLEREARAVSQLNHPNIVAIYDIGSDRGTHYVVMELLEGETLATRLHSGRLSAGKALDYAIQIARGLAAAHEKHIVHRDLKPENIFLTRDGRVKILDFGLARQIDALGGSGSTRLTQPGMVVGTASFMAPEQVRGLPTDHRSDIFAFGIVLYEMLSGTNPFEADTHLEAMMNILNREPANIAEVVPNVPPILQRVVHRCLEKAPENRFQTASDLIFNLETCSQLPVSAITTPAPIQQPRRFPRWAMVTVAVLALAALLAAAFVGIRSLWPEKASAPVFRRITFRRGIVQSARFTADGRTIVYAAGWDGDPLRLYLSRMERPEFQSLRVPRANLASISPSDAMAIILDQKVFDWTEGGTLAEVPVLGGTPREILEGVIHADWSPSGELAVVRRTPKGTQIEYPIGRVLHAVADHYALAMRISPKGDQLAVHLLGNRAVMGEVAVIGMDGKKRTLVKDVVSGPGMAWSPDGKEIWFSATPPGPHSAGPAIFAVTMDGEQRLLSRMPWWLWLHDISREGVALVSHNIWQSGIIVPGFGGGDRELSWLDWSILADVSADGRSVLFTEGRDGVANKPTIYVRNTDDAQAVRLGDGAALAFSPDRKWALALRESPAGRKVILLPLQAGQTETLRNDLDALWAGWLPDGRIVLSARTAQGPRMFVQPRGGAAPRPITSPGTAIGLVDAEGAGGVKPVSPDGRWIVVFDAEQRAWLHPIGGGPPRPLLGMLPDDRPAGWSRDGRHLYVYQLQEVPIRVHEIDTTTGERKLFKEITISDPAGVYKLGMMILMPDGQSFAIGYKRTLSTLYAVEGLR